MDDEIMFSPSRVTYSNLDLLAKEQGKLHEAAICEMSFAARSVAGSWVDQINDGMSINELVSALSEEILFPPAEPSADTPDFTVDSVRAFIKQQNEIGKAVFAERLVYELSELGVSVGEASYLDTEAQPQTFAYVKNSLSDEAFDVFSQEFSDPRVVYVQSFKEACMAVVDRMVGYCILPFEEKGGARIPTISALVSSLDLKIIAITPVFGFEGTAGMKYALVGRSFIIPDREDTTDRYFELTVSCNSGVSLGEILGVAEYMSLSVYRVYTVVSDDFESDAWFTLILKDGGTTFANFLTYLSLFVGEYEPTGIYKNIE